MFKDQKGIVHILGLLVALAAIGVVFFLLISSSAPFKNKLFSSLFPKPASHASELGVNLVDKDFKNQPELVPDQYIVVLKDKDQVTSESIDPEVEADKAETEQGVKKLHTYKHALNGYSFKGTADQANALKKNPKVKSVTQDHFVHILQTNSATASATPAAQLLPTGIMRIGADHNSTANIGKGGKVNVNVAVIDTGVGPHSELNIMGGVNCASDTPPSPAPLAPPVPPYSDGYGHGTHVAGTIGALDNSTGVVGVAPGANIYSVRVLDSTGSGSFANVACGIDWVTGTRDPSDGDSTNDIAVANMSLGGGGSNDGNCGNTNNDVMHQAICASVAKGVVYAVAAGNSNIDAGNFIPAAYDEVITVSAVADSNGDSGGTGQDTQYGPDDTLATFSDYGQVVDIGAPGVNIYSTLPMGSCYLCKASGYGYLSGTSMATPHVAGAIALYVAKNGKATDAAGVAKIRQDMVDVTKGYAKPQGSDKGFTQDRDSFQEPILYVADGSAEVCPSSGSNDVAVTNISAPPNWVYAPPGTPQTLAVPVTATNLGPVTQTFNVRMTDTTINQDLGTQQVVDLAPGASKVLIFTMDTSLYSQYTAVGNHALKAVATQVACESNLDNNKMYTTVKVVTGTHDMSVSNCSATNSVKQGQVVYMGCALRNLGTESETSTYTVTNTRDGIILVNAQPVSLAPPPSGGSQPTITWQTTSATLTGDYIIKEEIAPVPGEINLSDNSQTMTVTVTSATATPTPVPTFTPLPTPTPNTGDTTPPAVSISQPSNGAELTVGTQIPVKVNATDTSPGKISGVEFWVDGVKKTSDNSSPYTYNFKATEIGKTYTIEARAFDSATPVKNQSSSIITVKGGKDSILPTTSITSPTTNSSVTAGKPVVLQATASDAVGVKTVDFYVSTNGSLASRKCSVSTPDSSGHYNCSFNASSTAGTVYTLTTKATDLSGNAGNLSGAVTVTTASATPANLLEAIGNFFSNLFR